MVDKASAHAVGVGGGQNISEDWTRFGKKQILSIGKKRQRFHDEEDEIVDEGVGYDSSSDEEEGRTSAVREKARKVRPTVVAATATRSDEPAGIEPTSSKTKKKKRGKKERAKDAAETAEPSIDTTTTDAPKLKEGDLDKNNETAKKDGPANNDSNGNPASKRKRKKVRSRQKNIRKDNRSMDAKPSHLVLGRSEYAGRPMTKETKKKLGLELPNNIDDTSLPDDAFNGGEWVGAGDKIADNNIDNGGGEDVGESITKQTKPRTEGGGNPLAKIGDCIVGGGDTTEFNDAVIKERAGEDMHHKKGKKKHKKRKFKNLAVG